MLRRILKGMSWYLLGAALVMAGWLVVTFVTANQPEDNIPTRNEPFIDDYGMKWWEEDGVLTNEAIDSNCPDGQVIKLTAEELQARAEDFKQVEAADEHATAATEDGAPLPPPPPPEEGHGKFNSQAEYEAYMALLEELGGIPSYCVDWGDSPFLGDPE